MYKALTKNLSFDFSSTFALLISVSLIAISAQLSIPLPNGVPITLQTFTVALIGFCLCKNNQGIKSIIFYLFLGLIGMPIFSLGNSGFSTLLGLTGGFLYGFIFLAYFCQKSKKSKKIISKLLFTLLGLLSCHFFGVLQYSILTGISFSNSALLVSIPFLLKDSLSILLALICSSKVKYE
ncbi:MAG: biotin transporter BioY [Clostridia bacterium]|jgi:biotin transport system substrate-specific component|nr:biotin transporter BioY [Clostridia bacterium]